MQSADPELRKSAASGRSRESPSRNPAAPATPTPIPATPKRTDVEALRAVAILFVVLFHCGIPGVPGGFIGVDVFFVVSGYLITGLLVAENRKSSRIDLLRFYARRVRRLLPASFLVTISTLLAAAVIFAPQELTLAARGARASALYVSNIFFAIEAADYFAPRVASNPFLHMWSLAVEEQFYLVWPILILLGLSVFKSTRALNGILLGMTLLSLGACVWMTSHHAVYAFYLLPSRAWEFGIGGLAALLPPGRVRLPWLTLGLLGAAALAASCLLISSTSDFPGWIAVVPVLATACMLVAGAEEPHRGLGRVFDLGAFQTIGGLSYSWYLWHWPFLVLAAALFPGVTAAGKITAATAALAVAYATHRLFENPIRFNSYLVKRPVLTLALAIAITAVSVLAAMRVNHFADRLAQSPELKSVASAQEDIAAMSRNRCVSTDGSSEVKSCTFGPADSPTTVVLFGDSHAVQWFSGLREISVSNGWKLTTLLKSACAPAALSTDRGAAADAECSSWREQAIRNILTLRPSVVLMVSATNKLGRRSDPSVRASDAQLAEVLSGTRHTLSTFSSSGLHVIMVRDNPEFTFDVPMCLARSLRHSWYPGGSCEQPRAAVLDTALFEAEQRAAENLPGVRLVDLTDQFCPDGMCRSVRDGVVMYRDTDHLTGAFSVVLAPLLESEIRAALPR